MKLRILFFFTFIMICSLSRAQYYGGSQGAAYTSAFLPSASCPVNSDAPYAGDINDGYDRGISSSVIIYKGGSDNGNYAGSILPVLSCVSYGATIYKGGNDSAAYKGSYSSSITCPALAAGAYYIGGNGNGSSDGSYMGPLACSSPVVTPIIYYGGNYGGFSDGQFNPVVSCASFGLAAAYYFGGNGDGANDAEDTATTACFPAPGVAAYYFGGNGNGANDGEDTATTVCTPANNGAAYYFGGSGQGVFAAEFLASTTCSSPGTSSIYYGGQNLGLYMSSEYPAISCGTNPDAPYAGDINDGYDRGFTSSVIMYKGGADNGSYAGVYTPSTASCPVFISNNYFGGSNNGNYAGTYTGAATCPALAAGSYYYGGDGDGNSDNQDLASTTCTSSFTTSVIYAGGNYGGFSESEDTALLACSQPGSASLIYAGGYYGGYSDAEDTAVLACSQSFMVSDIYEGGYYNGASNGEFLAALTCVSAFAPSPIYAGGFYNGFGTDDFTINNITPTVTLAASDDTVCAGESITFTASPLAGGPSPVWQWYLNGNSFTNNSNIFVMSAPANNDVVSVSMTSSLSCSPTTPVNSGNITVYVMPALTNNSISANQFICSNTQAQLFNGSTPSGGNSSFIYLWESSPDNIIWNTAVGTSNGEDYDPSLVSTDLFLQRKVSSPACQGISTSNVVTIEFAATPTAISSVTSSSGTCNILSENNWILIPDQSNNLIAAVYDSTGGNNLGSTFAIVTIDGSVQVFNGRPYMQRHVEINPVSNGSARVRLFFSQAELNNLMAADPGITTIADLGVTKFSGPGFTGGVFVMPDTVLADTPFLGTYTVELSVSGFSDFIIHNLNNGNPLPIDLLYFDAACEDNNVVLNWATATETNNDYFTVEKSRDTRNWSVVDIIDAAGNSTDIKRYGMSDKEQSEGVTYYRLRQTDYDGRYSVTSAVPSSCFTGSGESISVFPNPVSDGKFSVSVYFRQPDKGVVSITNVLGQTITERNLSLHKGNNLLHFDLGAVGAGLYNISIRTEDGISLNKDVMLVK
jgi:hypothetical protein